MSTLTLEAARIVDYVATEGHDITVTHPSHDRLGPPAVVSIGYKPGEITLTVRCLLPPGVDADAVMLELLRESPTVKVTIESR